MKKINHGETILFTGDSITDCGRNRQSGSAAELGEGYVAFVDSKMAANNPATRIRVLNTGTSGNRVVELETRWQTDVLDLQPDWLSIMIGVNDIWNQLRNPLDPDPVTIDRYENIYHKLLEQTHPQLKGLVLMPPFFLETNPSDPMREQIDAYGAIVKKLADEFDAVFVDVQAAFDRHMKHRTTQSLSNDRIHPNKTGHCIIADAFLTATGFDQP